MHSSAPTIVSTSRPVNGNGRRVGIAHDLRCEKLIFLPASFEFAAACRDHQRQPARQRAIGLNEEFAHLALPAFIYLRFAPCLLAPARNLQSLNIRRENHSRAKTRNSCANRSFAKPPASQARPDDADALFLQPILLNLQHKTDALHFRSSNVSKRQTNHPQGIMWPVVSPLCSPASHRMAFAQSCGRMGRLVSVRCA